LTSKGKIGGRSLRRTEGEIYKPKGEGLDGKKKSVFRNLKRSRKETQPPHPICRRGRLAGLGRAEVKGKGRGLRISKKKLPSCATPP